MSEKVVFSQLSRKFIDENDATPAEAQQVVYYSLAIGHQDRKSTRLNSSHSAKSRMPSSA